MSMIRYAALVAALVVAAPSSAQQPGVRQPHEHAFSRLLEKRQELGLTAEQVSHIEAIRDRLEAQNRPLREQIQAARRQAGLPDRSPEARGGERPRLTEEQRNAARQMRDRMAPVAEQLRGNTRTAVREIHGVLTDAQRGQLRQMHREHGRGHGRGGRRGHGGHGARRARS